MTVALQSRKFEPHTRYPMSSSIPLVALIGVVVVALAVYYFMCRGRKRGFRRHVGNGPRADFTQLEEGTDDADFEEPEEAELPSAPAAK